MLENLFSSPFLNSLALTLLHFLWQGLLVATVLKSALLIFNNNKAQLRYALSALAMLVNLLLPIITFIIVYRAEISLANPLVSSLALNEFIQELKQPDALFSYKEFTETLPLLLPYISVLWLTTVTLLACKLLVEISTVNQLPKQGTFSPSDKLQARFDELVKQIQLRITPRLLISLKVEVPMAIGWLKPVVLMPASMISGLNNAQLEMLILHELAHIRRHDYLVNFLQTLVEILLFFHPAVLWVSKQMRNEREYCSDDIAVQHCGDPIAYAHTLADTASLCTKAHNHTIPDMAMAASGGDLKQRVIRLVGHHCAPSNNISKWFASATIIFSVLLLSSKHLLTMPLLNIWHDENPWNQTNHTRNNTGHNIEKQQITSNTFKKDIPNTSIAQQLLTPKESTYQIDEQDKSQALLSIRARPADNKVLALTIEETETQKNAANDLIKNKPLYYESPRAVNSQTSLFNTKLDSLSANNSSKPKEDIENTVTSNSLMVNEAFERTNSSNPYQQQLAALQATEITVNESSINKTNNSQHAILLKEPTSTNQFSDNTFKNNIRLSGNADVAKATNRVMNTFANVSFTEDKEISPSEAIWHNAKQLESANPVYPSVAKRKGIEIEVKVDFTIDVDGQIKDIQFVHQNKINYFKSSIRSAIKKWRFLPAKVNDKPVESQMSKVFAFSLQS
jgi:TonB family protein